MTHFAERFAVQLNDTHPSIGVAELMRLLVDERRLDWETAWGITVADLRLHQPHAVARGAGDLAAAACSRSCCRDTLEIIYEINRRFLDEVRTRFPGDDARVARLSLIDEEGDKRVRMAHLATVGSHAVNGVAALHSELLKASVLKDFYELWPERFSNKTNGVTPRRFLALCNPGLRALLDRDDRRRVAGEPGIAAEARAVCGRRGVPPRVARGQAGEQGAPGGLHPSAHGHRARSRLDVRHPGQAHPRIQAPAPERAAHRHAVPAAQGEPGAGGAAARVHLRRQGGARLSHGEAHHQAHQRRRRDGQRRSGREHATSRWRSCPTSTSRTRTASIRPPICPSRSRPPARRPPAPAT